MTTTIETTDYVHETGMRMVSLKDITTELPEGWEAGLIEQERDSELSRMHAVDLAIAQYQGRCAEGRGDAEVIKDAQRRLEDAAWDMDIYLSTCDEIAQELAR